MSQLMRAVVSKDDNQIGSIFGTFTSKTGTKPEDISVRTTIHDLIHMSSLAKTQNSKD